MSESQNRPIRVLLVEDHKTVIWGLEKLIDSAWPDMQKVGAATCKAAALAAAAEHSPHVVVLDLDLGGESGLDLIPQFVRTGTTRVVVLTGVRDPAIYEHAVIAGARGIVHKSEPAPVILKAIERVHAGEMWLDGATVASIFAALSTAPQSGRAPNPEPAHSRLTAAERKTMAAVVHHKSAPNKVIASTLHLSEHTLRNHLASIYSKLGLHKRLELVLYALDHKLDNNTA